MAEAAMRTLYDDVTRFINGNQRSESCILKSTEEQISFLLFIIKFPHYIRPNLLQLDESCLDIIASCPGLMPYASLYLKPNTNWLVHKYFVPRFFEPCDSALNKLHTLTKGIFKDFVWRDEVTHCRLVTNMEFVLGIDVPVMFEGYPTTNIWILTIEPISSTIKDWERFLLLHQKRSQIVKFFIEAYNAIPLGTYLKGTSFVSLIFPEQDIIVRIICPPLRQYADDLLRPMNANFDGLQFTANSFFYKYMVTRTAQNSVLTEENYPFAVANFKCIYGSYKTCEILKNYPSLKWTCTDFNLKRYMHYFGKNCYLIESNEPRNVFMLGETVTAITINEPVQNIRYETLATTTHSLKSWEDFTFPIIEQNKKLLCCSEIKIKLTGKLQMKNIEMLGVKFLRINAGDLPPNHILNKLIPSHAQPITNAIFNIPLDNDVTNIGLNGIYLTLKEFWSVMSNATPTLCMKITPLRKWSEIFLYAYSGEIIFD